VCFLFKKKNENETTNLNKVTLTSNKPDFQIDLKFDPSQSLSNSQKNEKGFLQITHKLQSTLTPSLQAPASILSSQHSTGSTPASATLNFNFPLVQNKIDELNE
jgi:hypothetical protein